MKLVTFDAGCVGRIDGSLIVELDYPSMAECLASRGEMSETGRRVDASSARLRAPLRPSRLLHTTGNFLASCRELAMIGPRSPRRTVCVWQNSDAVVGPGDAVRYPQHLTKELDYELELGVVIADDCGPFGPGQALNHVAAYVIVNGLTARDIQRREMQTGQFPFSKAIATFSPIGPWLVTPDEIRDPQDLGMELRVNGEVRQTGHTSQMMLSIPQLLAYHSTHGYRAGDVITTGTIAGVAAAQADPFDFYLKPGDVVEAEIEHLGVLRNHVVSAAPSDARARAAVA